MSSESETIKRSGTKADESESPAGDDRQTSKAPASEARPGGDARESEATGASAEAATASRPGATPSSAARGPAWLSRVHAWFESRYGLDLRSIAAFRIGMGYMLLYDLVMRARDLEAHYTDAGILPRERLVGGWGQKLFYSLHIAGGDMVSQAALFLVAGVFAVMLLVGYKSRLAAIVSWILLCSLQSRNYIILQGGDDLMRVLLFWAMFLPLSARFSVDAVLAEHSLARAQGQPLQIRPSTQRKLPKQVLSAANMAIVMQLFTMYFVSAALKTGPTWHKDGSAIHLALHHHAFASWFGQIFRQAPNSVLQGMTWQTWWLELAGPLLFFIPWGTFWWRFIQALLFISFHFGLFLTMELGHFPWIAIVGWLLVLPSWFWDRPLYQLTLKFKLRDLLRDISVKLQTRILAAQRWLGEPYKLPRVRPTLLATLVLLGIASYAGYGSAYAMAHGGNVSGERFNPLLMTRLYANWGMFAPNPPATSGWFVTVARQKNGNEVDVWNNGQPVTFEMPSLPSATYKRQRWRKFGDNILSSGHAPMRGYLLRYLCRSWNESHPPEQAIEKITLYHMAQTVNWPGHGYGPLSKNELARETCPPPDGQAPKENLKPAKPSKAKAKAKPQPRHGAPPGLNAGRNPGRTLGARPAASATLPAPVPRGPIPPRTITPSGRNVQEREPATPRGPVTNAGPTPPAPH